MDQIKRNLVYNISIGLAFAFLYVFFMFTILMFQDSDISINQVWINMLVNMILGIYFGIASLIFEIEKWSFLKQLVVHFVLSIVIWFLIAVFVVEWISFTPFSILISFGVFIGIYLLFWMCFIAYYKKVETELNDLVK